MTRLALPLALCGLATLIVAQTSTTCDPLNVTCPSDPALGTTFYSAFDASMTEFNPQLFNVTAGADLISFTDDGAQLTIDTEGESITIQTNFYIFFGTIEVLFRAATGQGIISTFNMLSDDLDEIDVEIMGGNTSYTSTNFYGWGNTSQFNTKYIPSTGGSWGTKGAMGAVHNYTVSWTTETLNWIFDDELVRSVPYQPAGKWPQTPSFLKFGIWAGGASTEPKGTIAWAGGPVDWSQGPFVMTVQSIRMIDAHTNVSSYSYGGHSGSWESIDVQDGLSAAYNVINAKSTTQQIEEQWDGLSTNAKIGVACGVGGGLAIALIAFIFYCVRQRRAGRREREAAEKQWEMEQAELLHYRERMKRGDFAVSHMGHGKRF